MRTTDWNELKESILFAYADCHNVKETPTGRKINYKDRNLDWIAKTTCSLLELKNILGWMGFGGYNEFDHQITIDSLIENFGDVDVYFAREGSVCMYLVGVSGDTYVHDGIAGSDECDWQPDDSVRLWWD